MTPRTLPVTVLLGLALGCMGSSHEPSPPPTEEPMDEPVPPPPSGRPAHPDAPFTAVTDAGGLLEPGDILARAVRGPFGPRDDCVLAIVQRGTRRAFHALLACGDDRWHAGPIGVGDWSGEELQELVLRDVDGDGYVEAVVIASWTTGIGPEGVIPFLGTSVLRWSGTDLERMLALELRLAPLQSVEAVIEAL